MTRLRGWLDVNGDADRLLDQATAAEFRGFQAYQDHLRWDRLRRSCRWRARGSSSVSMRTMATVRQRR